MFDNVLTFLTCFAASWFIANFAIQLQKCIHRNRLNRLKVNAAKQLVSDFKVARQLDPDIGMPNYDLTELNEQYDPNRPS